MVEVDVAVAAGNYWWVADVVAVVAVVFAVVAVAVAVAC